MEKIQLKEELKQEYVNLINAAQQVEQAIGSAEYRTYKLKGQREQIDVELRGWWEKTAKDMDLDRSFDYYVDNDGAINKVDKPKVPTQEAPVDKEVVVDEDASKEGGTVEDLI